MLDQRHLWSVILLGFGFVTSVHASADDLSRGLDSRYRHKVFVLKNFYSGDALTFDSAGRLSSPAAQGDWTENGIIEISKIRIKHQKVEIDANRILAYTDRTNNLGLARVKLPLKIEGRTTNNDDFMMACRASFCNLSV